MISFIIPAHNEERCLPATLEAAKFSAATLNEPYEIIVVDDASTDGTSNIALDHGARLIQVTHRQIAATRNAGARAAVGDVLFFVDADTQVAPAAVREALQAIRDGAVGGGCVYTFDGRLPFWARVLYPVAVCLARWLRFVGGACLYCRRDVFHEFGGFCEAHFAAEEKAFMKALKARGPFVVPNSTVITSGRKLRAYSCWEIISEVFRWTIRGGAAYRSREGLDLWYGERRPDPEFEAPDHIKKNSGANRATPAD